MSFSSPLLGSSPPAKSSSLPIKRAGGLSRSFAQTVVQPKQPAEERRSSETGQRQQSFSFSKTPFASYASTASASTAAKPPAVPAVHHRPSLRVEGFSAPSDSNNAALSPGKLQTKSSLLTASLLEPATGFCPELFGAVQPQHQFQVIWSDAQHVTAILLSSEDGNAVSAAAAAECQPVVACYLARAGPFRSSLCLSTWAFTCSAQSRPCFSWS
jgi:hypothetical protein